MIKAFLFLSLTLLPSRPRWPHYYPPCISGEASSGLQHSQPVFIGFIDHSLKDVDYLVRDKLLFEHILNMELKGPPPSDKAILYNDNGRSFNSVLVYGHEWTLMLFDLLMFAFVDSFAQDFG